MLVPATDSRGLSHSELFVLSRGLVHSTAESLLQLTPQDPRLSLDFTNTECLGAKGTNRNVMQKGEQRTRAHH